MQSFGKGALRVAKNYTKGFTDTQSRVRDATSNDPWGPSGTQMNEIALLTYNQNDFVEIVEILDKRLNDKGKNWRHVFKSLTVLDYCLHAGSQNMVIYFRKNIYIIKTLREFQFIDEDEKDQGANVRHKAQDITNLLQDERRLQDERKNRASMNSRMVESNHGYNNRDTTGRKDRLSEEDSELLQAIQLSEEEEKKRIEALEESNKHGLFDDIQDSPTNLSDSSDSGNLISLADSAPYTAGLQPQYTAFQQPLQQIQPQFTAMPGPQQQFQPQFTSMPLQQQFTAFDPYQQQAEQAALQAEYVRQQQAFQLQQEQQAQWVRLQQQQQQQQQMLPPMQNIQPQPTSHGTKNPFAPTASVSTISPQSTPASTHINSPQSNDSFRTPVNTVTVPRVQIRTDGQHAQLEGLFADREGGQDTFGNVGSLRYGHTEAGRVISQKSYGGGPGGTYFNV